MNNPLAVFNSADGQRTSKAAHRDESLDMHHFGMSLLFG